VLKLVFRSDFVVVYNHFVVPIMLCCMAILTSSQLYSYHSAQEMLKYTKGVIRSHINL